MAHQADAGALIAARDMRSLSRWLGSVLLASLTLAVSVAAQDDSPTVRVQRALEPVRAAPGRLFETFGDVVYDLEAIGRPGVEPLSKVIDEDEVPEVRFVAVLALGNLHLGRVLPLSPFPRAVREALGDPDGRVRFAAALTLWNSVLEPDPELFEHLLAPPTIDSRDAWNLLASLEYGFQSVTRADQRPRLVKKLEPFLTSSNPRSRLWAAIGLIEFETAVATARAELLRLAAREEIDIWLPAVQRLAWYAPETGLEQPTPSEARRLRLEAIRSLGLPHAPPRRLLPVFLALVKHGPAREVEDALIAAARLGGLDAGDIVDEVLNPKSSFDDSSAALGALQSLPQAQVDRLFTALGSDVPDHWEASAQTLRRFAVADETIRNRLGQPPFPRRLAVVDALAGGPVSERTLEALALALLAPDDYLIRDRARKAFQRAHPSLREAAVEAIEAQVVRDPDADEFAVLSALESWDEPPRVPLERLSLALRDGRFLFFSAERLWHSAAGARQVLLSHLEASESVEWLSAAMIWRALKYGLAVSEETALTRQRLAAAHALADSGATVSPGVVQQLVAALDVEQLRPRILHALARAGEVPTEWVGELPSALLGLPEDPDRPWETSRLLADVRPITAEFVDDLVAHVLGKWSFDAVRAADAISRLTGAVGARARDIPGVRPVLDAARALRSGAEVPNEAVPVLVDFLDATSILSLRLSTIRALGRATTSELALEALLEPHFDLELTEASTDALVAALTHGAGETLAAVLNRGERQLDPMWSERITDPAVREILRVVAFADPGVWYPVAHLAASMGDRAVGLAQAPEVRLRIEAARVFGRGEVSREHLSLVPALLEADLGADYKIRILSGLNASESLQKAIVVATGRMLDTADPRVRPFAHNVLASAEHVDPETAALAARDLSTQWANYAASALHNAPVLDPRTRRQVIDLAGRSELASWLPAARVLAQQGGRLTEAEQARHEIVTLRTRLVAALFDTHRSRPLPADLTLPLLEVLADEGELTRQIGIRPAAAAQLGRLSTLSLDVLDRVIALLRHSDVEVRTAASLAVTRTTADRERVDEALLDLLAEREPRVFFAALVALHHREYSRTVLQEHLRDRRAGEFTDVVTAGLLLAVARVQLGAGAPLPEQLAAIRTAWEQVDPFSRSALVDQLAAVGRIASRGIASALIDRVHNDSRYLVQDSALRGLREVAGGEPDVLSRVETAIHKALEDQLKNDGPLIAQTAVETLGALPMSQRIAQILEDVVRSENFGAGIAATQLVAVHLPDEYCIRTLTVALTVDNAEVRRTALIAFTGYGGQVGLEGALLATRKGAVDDFGLRQQAIEWLGKLSSPPADVFRALGERLGDVSEDTGVRLAAARSLARFPWSDEVQSALIRGLLVEDGEVRRAAAQQLKQRGRIDRKLVDGFVHVLRNAKDVDATQTAAIALGGAKADRELAGVASKELIRTLWHADDLTRWAAAVSLGQLAPVIDDDVTVIRSVVKAAVSPPPVAKARASSSAGPFALVVKEYVARVPKAKREALRQSLDQPGVAAADEWVQKDVVRPIRDYADRLGDSFPVAAWKWAKAEPEWSIPLAYVAVMTLLCSALLLFRPLQLLRLSAALASLDFFEVKGLGVGPRLLFLVNLFHYHPLVLSAWVRKRADAARQNLKARGVVAKRRVHLDLPVSIEGSAVPKPGQHEGISADELRSTFGAATVCVLITGVGGSGKTSLACRIARLLLSSESGQRPAADLVLPVIIDQPLTAAPESTPEGEPPRVKSPAHDDFLEVVRGQLRLLVGDTDPIPPKLFKKLLSSKRVLVVVDHLSEMDELTRAAILADAAETPINALMVTSRDPDELDGRRTTVLEPQRIEAHKLTPFLYSYLRRSGTELNDEQLIDASRDLRKLVRKRDVTVLFARLFADWLVTVHGDDGSPESPGNVPDLMLAYLDALNRTRADDDPDDRAVHRDLTLIAWLCMCRTLRPESASFSEVDQKLVGDQEDKMKRLAHLEKKLKVIESKGNELSLALDPLSEHLGALYLVESVAEDEAGWRAWMQKYEPLLARPREVQGFIYALRDAIEAREKRIAVPAFVLQRVVQAIAEIEQSDR